MRIWNAEYALDGIEIPDCNLDVILRPEGRPWIQVWGFDEYALYRIEGGPLFFSLQVVKIVKNGTIQVVP